MVYLSDPERHQIIRIKAIEDIPELEKNFEVVIGSGDRCLPGDKNNCGDGGLAKDAKLMYPKGINTIETLFDHYLIHQEPGYSLRLYL